MLSKYQLRRNMQRYQTLDTKLRRIITELDHSADRLGKLELEMNHIFQINGSESSVSRRTKKLKKNIEGTSDYLRGTVLPSVHSSADSTRRAYNALGDSE